MDRTQQDLIGEAPAFLNVMEHVSRLAPLNRSVLVIGERGTGKELIAHRLHYLSPRWGEPFIKLDCAALPEALLESELFGHEAGAFTGAEKKRHGRFELADGGTLFLDELANSPVSVQDKILRVIEYGAFERLGGSTTVEVDVRLIAATNEDLPALAAEGRFRPDLLDRLAFDVITLPPLTARREDILPLAEHFAMRMTSELQRDYFAGFEREAARALLEYDWPGNVRELKNVVERAVCQTESADQPISEIIFDPFDSPWRPRRRGIHGSAAAQAETKARDPDWPVDLRAEVAELEQRRIEQALQASKHNQRKAAELLGLSYHQLRGLLRKYEMTGDV